MQLLLLFYIWLWMSPEVRGAKGGSKKDPPYFTSYEMGVIKKTQSLWGRTVTTCANGSPAFFVWDPLTQYKVHLFCAACGQPLRVHKWHRRVACLLEENCILLMRGYACRHQVKAVLVGCGKMYHSWEIHSQLTPTLQRAFPFILFQRSALHKQVLRLVLTGLSKGVSMSATAEQMASLYEGRYNEVVFHADVILSFSDWGVPSKLVSIGSNDCQGGCPIKKGFYDSCLKSLGAHKLSADHTFKIAKKCTVKIDHHFEKLFESAYFMLNELGMVLAWRFLEDASIPSDLLEELSQRPNMFVEEIHSDRCCGEVLVWQKYFPDAHLCLDLFHAIQRVVREISKKEKGSATAAKAFGMCFRGTGDKNHVRSETSRTQTFDDSEPDNVRERVSLWKKTFGYHVNSKVRAEVAKQLDNHPDCLFPQHYSGTQLNECLHRLLNALTSMRTASAPYMENVLTYLIHLFNVKKFTKAWAHPEKLGITHDHLRKLAPPFAACLECNMPIPTRWGEAATTHSMWKSTNPQAQEFPRTCTTRFGLPTNQVPQTLTEEALMDDDEEDDCFQGGDKEAETIDGKIWDWLENVEKECIEGPSFDENADAEVVADWWEKWVGVRSHIAREFRVSSLFDEPARNAQRRPRW